MSDLISRSALIESFEPDHSQDWYTPWIVDKINNAPTVEVNPVVHGEWIADERDIYFCSVCDSEAYWDTDYGQQLFDHCPYCGANMRKNNKEG